MTAEIVQDIIRKAVSDPEFRELLFSNPDKALEGYELSEEEVESLKQIERNSFEENLSELEERVSRGTFSVSTLNDLNAMLSNIGHGAPIGSVGGLGGDGSIIPPGTPPSPSIPPSK